MDWHNKFNREKLMATINDVSYRISKTVNNDISNGGRIGAELPDAGNTLYPGITQSDRVNGAIFYRKVWLLLGSSDNNSLNNNRIFLDGGTPGADRVVLFFLGAEADSVAQQDSIQDDIIGTERTYGAGTLTSGVSAGATSIDVTIEDGSDVLFLDTDEIIIFSHSEYDLNDGVEEFAVISGAPVVNGTTVTITLASGLVNNYSLGDKVSSTIKTALTQASASDKSVTSPTGGDLDIAQITFTNVNAYPEVFTATFTSSTAFDLAGDSVGTIGGFTINNTITPTNPDTSGIWFTLPAAAWSGTFASGDVVSFRVNPCALSYWEKRIIPAGASVFAGNERNVGFYTEIGS